MPSWNETRKLFKSVSDNPKDELLFSGREASSVLLKDPADIYISIGINGEFKTLIKGRMDNAYWDLDDEYGETVQINGRSGMATIN